MAEASAEHAKQHSVFAFRACSVTIDPQTWWLLHGVRERKTILFNVAGKIESGGVLAIMGASGAGKTTLLKLLSAAPSSPDEMRTGEVTLNGHLLSTSSEHRAVKRASARPASTACLRQRY